MFDHILLKIFCWIISSILNCWLFVFFLQQIDPFHFGFFSLVSVYFIAKFLGFLNFFRLVLWLLIENPEYRGPTKFVELANNEDFESFMMQKNSIKHFKFVEFYTPRLTNCMMSKFFIKIKLKTFLFIDLKHVG